MSSPTTPAHASAAFGSQSTSHAGSTQGASVTTHVGKSRQIEAPSTAGAVGTSLLMLIFVIGLILVLGKLAKRLPGVGAAAGSDALRVVASIPLGAKERAVVIDVNGTQLLVGVGAGGTRVLHQLEQSLPVAEAKPAIKFSEVLAHIRKPK